MSSSLKNKVIVLTRSHEQANESAKKLESLGVKVILFPTIKAVPIKVFNQFDNYAERLSTFDYIVFTSENAVKFSLERLKDNKTTIPDNVKVVCVGNKTADKCKEYDINVDIIPGDFSAKGLLKYFESENILEKKFFIPTSEIARDELKMGLIEQGAEVVRTPIYDIALPDKDENNSNIEKITANKPDLFIFTSPSTFNNFIEIVNIEDPKSYFETYKIAAIGPTTASAIEENGITVDITPANYTMDGLIDSIIDYYSEQQ